MKRPNAGTAATSAPPPDDDILADAPTLLSFLADPSWDDGTERELSTLMLFRQDGRWKACLNDRATRRVAFTSSDTIEGLFARLERELVTDTTDWRAVKEARTRK